MSRRKASEDEPIFNRLEMLRVERGLSRKSLAEEVGVHYQTIGYIERGEYAPSLHLAFRVARYFAVPIEAVFSPEPFRRLGAEELLLGAADVVDEAS